MPTKADVSELRRNQGRIVKLAVADLEDFWGSLNLNKPERARDQLLRFIPTLTDEYGDWAATVAADWYEDVRGAAGAAGKAKIALADPVNHDRVRGDTRYAAGHLFTDEPVRTRALMAGALDRYVRQPGRDTISQSATREHARWARVPGGADPCAFCQMMGSRGFAYSSESHALGAEDYHDHCECEVVPSWDESPSLEGYDPGAMYSKYMSARADLDDTQSPYAILSRMREKYGMR